MKEFTVIVVEDVPLELKGTLQIFQNEIPEAKVIGTANDDAQLWQLLNTQVPDLILLDLGLGGSTTLGVDVCRRIRKTHADVRVLIFTGETMNERLWVDVLEAGADGIILKTGELLTRTDVSSVMDGKRMVFNQPILKAILKRFKKSVMEEAYHMESLVEYDIDEYDERLLRHLALGYTKEMISGLRGMPFGVKSIEKRQNDLVARLFDGEHTGVNATRLVTKAFQLHILNADNLVADEC